MEQPEHLDVLIIGAGLSGICAGAHMAMQRPRDSFAILEARDAIGGTWDLFRYPGVRSDSDMFTFGFRFRPWTEGKDIASASSILNYLDETVDKYDLRPKIRFGQRVTKLNWSPYEAKWELTVISDDGETRQVTCGYLMACSGYYDYAHPYQPEFPGRDAFKGLIAHPQHWPEDLDYAGKKVAVIGSGATAVTLVPTMAETAAKVTMVQRSPTYVASRPSVDPVAQAAMRYLPAKLAHRLARIKNIILGVFFYTLAQRRPDYVKRGLMKEIRKAVGPDVDVETHFNPTYDPWDQRLCLVPDGDLFAALKSRRADIVTDQIETFTATGLRTAGGQEIEADIIIPATGLTVQFLGGAEIYIDHVPLDLTENTIYRGMMLSDVPNLTVVFGYTNASWTLKADLTCDYVMRLLSYMETQGHKVATAVSDDDMARRPLINLESGYILRALAQLPKQGSRAPWRNSDNYILDMMSIRYGRMNDGVIAFR
ncbi:MAG: NAD(P)/FAD-dependent oxidoreductase [Pseudomonadota bacterium]